MGHITLTFPKTRSNPTRKSQLLDFVSLIFFGIVILFVLLIFTPLGDSLAASSNQALIKSNLADPKQRGGLIALIESEKYGKVVDVCVNGDVDYMSCEDPTRNSMLSREMNFYRERQCPGVDERAVCLVPAPSGYWVPIQWHESLHKEQIHIQIKLISDVVPRAKMDIWWRLRRGGMFAKVKAAAKLACFGTPVVIASGITSNNIVKVLNGERVGTLFHKDAHMWIPVTEVDPHELAVSAREASRRLQALTSEERRKILLDVAAALEANEQFITLENDADIETAHEAGYDESLVARLSLKPSKIRALAESVRRLADMEEPIGHVLKRTELVEGLVLEKKSCPLGVLLIVFESRPDALVQIASLAIRSGNGLLLKGRGGRS